MQRIFAISFSLIMLTISLAGCIGSDDAEKSSDNVEQEVFVCNEMDFITHEVTISLVEYEFDTWLDLEPIQQVLYIENSDLIYFENATQVLANGQIYDLSTQGAPVRDTHFKFFVYSNEDNEQQSIITNKGDVVCLIENPEIEHFVYERGRECASDSYRLENGSYEHVFTLCNYVLTEHLDRTSTIRGGIELTRNLEEEYCAQSASVTNVQNGNLVGLNYSLAGNWGHFLEGNEFRIYYNNEDYHKSYFVKELSTDILGGGIYSKGIQNLEACGLSFVQLYADENLTELASLDRNLTTNDDWEVIANRCSFYRSNFLLNSSEMTISHGCEGVYKGIDINWYETNYPDYDVSALLEQQNNPIENSYYFFDNFTQAMITKNYSMWHAMLDDDVHAINSNVTYDKANLTESFFENFTSVLGSIELENASRLDLAQSHWQLHQSYFPDSNSTFNWDFDPNNGNLGWVIASPIAESALLQDRIYNSTGWGYDDTFIESTEHIVMTWVPGPNTPLLISEYLLTIVVDRDDDGNLSIVGIADYNIEVSR